MTMDTAVYIAVVSDNQNRRQDNHHSNRNVQESPQSSASVNVEEHAHHHHPRSRSLSLHLSFIRSCSNNKTPRRVQIIEPKAAEAGTPT